MSPTTNVGNPLMGAVEIGALVAMTGSTASMFRVSSPRDLLTRAVPM
ncbi:MAG: hypothetical protein WB798_04135 [Nocardioidaceae bacterium]